MTKSRVFAIADLHLPGGQQDKAMDVFGAHWQDHFERIASDWRDRVGENDLVLIPGDISWAMTLPQAMADLRAIAALPGHKVMIRGNHDYWWNGIGRLRDALPAGMHALQNDAVVVGDWVVAGSRLWNQNADTVDDQRLYARELERLKLSLQHAARIGEGKGLIVMTHYPPCDEQGNNEALLSLMAPFEPMALFYGHLHGRAIKGAYEGFFAGASCHCVSCDSTDFKLVEWSPEEKANAT